MTKKIDKQKPKPKQKYYLSELKFTMVDEKGNPTERKIGRKKLEALQMVFLSNKANFWALLIEQSEPVSNIQLLK